MRREIAKYVGKDYMDEGDIHWTLEQKYIKTIPPPSRMGKDATDVDNDVFKVEVSEYVKHSDRLRANLDKRYTLILGQCNELTCMHIEGLPEWGATYDISYVIKLLKIIKSLSHQATDQKYHPLSLY